MRNLIDQRIFGKSEEPERRKEEAKQRTFIKKKKKGTRSKSKFFFGKKKRCENAHEVLITCETFRIQRKDEKKDLFSITLGEEKIGERGIPRSTPIARQKVQNVATGTKEGARKC